MGKRKKEKALRPPELPPEIDDDDVEVSEEDLEFVKENRQYTRFLRSFDKKEIDRRLTQAVDDGELEKLYEKQKRRAALLKRQEEELRVDPVDALPIKTLEGELVYQNVKRARSEDHVSADDKSASGEAIGKEKNVVALKTKLKKKQDTKPPKLDAHKDARVAQLQTGLLENEEELSAEDEFEQKKIKMAELGMELLENPEENVRSLDLLLKFCREKDRNVVKLGLMSMLAVFKDIIPGYRIRLPTEKERAVEVSKEVKKLRYYEYALLRSYKAYLKILSTLEKKPIFKHVAVRCMCALLDAAPHFNFREGLLARTVKNLSSLDDIVRKLCYETFKSLFMNEGKHRGEATFEIVRLIADHVRIHGCQLHPDFIQVFLSLKFDEDLGKQESKEGKSKPKKYKRGRHEVEENERSATDAKKRRQELILKTREEVNADLKSASFALDPSERRRMQTEVLSAVFETYFRILKNALDPTNSTSNSSSTPLPSVLGPHPLLAPCLVGLGKFSHLIDLDFMGDLMACLKKLAGFSENYKDGASCSNALTVSERLQCCIVAFKVMKSNLDALNVDLQDFFIQLYNLILEYWPDRDSGEILAEAFKVMLWEGKQHDMQRAAAFIKRLATFALSFGPAEAMAALVTIKHLLQKNNKCRNMLENDAGGGTLSGLVAKYQPEAADPYLSGALSSVLWELTLLQKHFNLSVAAMAKNILSMSSLHPNQNLVPLVTGSPLDVFRELSAEKELAKPMQPLPLSRKRKPNRRRRPDEHQQERPVPMTEEDEVRSKLQDHFRLLRDISENERLRAELKRTERAIRLYDEYKAQKKVRRKKPKTSREAGNAAAAL